MLTHPNEDVKYCKVVECMIPRRKYLYRRALCACVRVCVSYVFIVTTDGTRISIMVTLHSGLIVVSVIEYRVIKPQVFFYVANLC